MRQIVRQHSFAIALIVLAGVLLAAGCSSKPEYDPTKYVHLEYKYFNGEGMAVPVVIPPDTTDVESSQIKDLLALTRFNYSPENGLSNGDVVTAVPSYDEEKAEKKGFKPVVKEIEFTVAGLPEGVEVDAWDEIEQVIFKGRDGYGEFEYLTDHNGIWKDIENWSTFSSEYVHFKVDKYEELSNGDIVTLTLVYDAEQAREYGFKLISEPTKQFTVSGLTE